MIPVGCNAPTFTAGGFDQQEVSLEIVRMAVGLLSDGDYDPGAWTMAVLSLKKRGRIEDAASLGGSSLPCPPQMLLSRSMTVWLSRHVMQTLSEYARDLSSLENRGVLLGWRSKEDHIIVDLRGLGPSALHGRHCFVPDHKWQVA